MLRPALRRMVVGSGTVWRGVPWAAAVLALASLASAEDAPHVRFAAPEGCPDGSAVNARITALIGRPLRDADAIRVDGEVRQLGAAGWELTLRDAEGQVDRRLTGESCEALADATALMVAWALDPALDASSLGASSLAAPPDAPVGPASAARATQRPVHRDRGAALGVPSRALSRPTARAPLSIGLGAAFVLDLGSLPALAPGFLLEAVLRVDRLDLRLRGGWLATQRAHLPNVVLGLAEDAAIDVEWVGGSVHGCGRPLPDDAARPGLSLCAGVHVAVLLARGLGVSDPGRGEAPTASLGFGAAMPWVPIEALDLELGLEVLVPLSPPTFVLDGVAGGFTPAPVGGRLTLGGHFDVH